MIAIGLYIGQNTNRARMFYPVVVSRPVITSADDPIVIGSVLNISNGTWAALYLPLAFTYQWYKDGIALVGETTNSYTTTDNGIYYATVTATNSLNNSTTVPSNIIDLSLQFLATQGFNYIMTQNMDYLIL